MQWRFLLTRSFWSMTQLERFRFWQSMSVWFFFLWRCMLAKADSDVAPSFVKKQLPSWQIFPSLQVAREALSASNMAASVGRSDQSNNEICKLHGIFYMWAAESLRQSQFHTATDRLTQFLSPALRAGTLTLTRVFVTAKRPPFFNPIDAFSFIQPWNWRVTLRLLQSRLTSVPQIPPAQNLKHVLYKPEYMKKHELHTVCISMSCLNIVNANVTVKMACGLTICFLYRPSGSLLQRPLFKTDLAGKALLCLLPTWIT